MIKTYALLTKPGILMGNAITTLSGFLLASKGEVQVPLLIATVAGLGSVIASSCICNNCIDRVADAKMERTKERPLVKNLISVKSALLLAILLAVIGFGLLAVFTNVLTLSLAALGFFVYVVLYSLMKYHTVYGTLIGSVAGAMPPVVGYCAVTNRFDLGALLLLLVLVLWQMPHFYAIALYRYDDYKAADIPILPIQHGVLLAKLQMALYIVAFMVVAMLMSVTGYTGKAFYGIAFICGIAWLGLSLKGFLESNHKRWGRQMFVISLVIVNVLCFSMAIESFINLDSAVKDAKSRIKA